MYIKSYSYDDRVSRKVNAQRRAAGRRSVNCKPLPLSCTQWITVEFRPWTPDRPSVAHDLCQEDGKLALLWKHAAERERTVNSGRST